MTESLPSHVVPAAPTGEQLLEHLRAHPPRAPRRYGSALLLVIGVVIGVMVFSGPSLLSLLLPWAAIVGVFIWAARQKQLVTAVQNGVRSVRELTLLRRPREAADRAWRLIPDLAPFADLHVQTVMLMATNYTAQRAFDPALAAQDYLIEHIPDDHPVNRIVRLQRLFGWLHEDRLSDADDELRQLERADLDPMGLAMRRVARLYQQIKTNHHQEAVEDLDAGDLVRELRPAGVEAAAGFALAACAALQVGRLVDAMAWWRRATMLLPPDAVVRDTPELQPLLRLPPAPTLARCLAEDGA